MKIDINYTIPESKCDDCKFLVHKQALFSQGKSTFICVLTNVGDNWCDNSGEEQIAKRKMLEVCPFNSPEPNYLWVIYSDIMG